MSKSRKLGAAPTVATEYDFTQGVRGKHARRYAEGTNVIVLEPDVAAVFHSPGQVNEALRGLAALIRRQSPMAPK